MPSLIREPRNSLAVWVLGFAAGELVSCGPILAETHTVLRLSERTIEEAAARLEDAERMQRPIPPLVETYPPSTAIDAY